jgi:hypothetical protein
MKNSRAPGEDLITAELIKHGDSMLQRRIHRLIEEVWETEQMPQAWSTALICPIHKLYHDFNRENGKIINDMGK